MNELDRSISAPEAEEESESRPRLSPGKRTLTSRIPAPRAVESDDASRATEAVASSGGGQALAAGPASFFGDAYGADFGGVRVHTGSSAADAAGAEAFTYGNDIFFGAGRYQPETNHGAFVLGHELAHVAQQGGQPAVQPKLADDGAQQKLEIGSESDPAEAEASSAARTAMSGGKASISRSPARIRFFKQGTGSRADGGHAYMTEQALNGMGVSAGAAAGQVSAARSGRQGNWMRDLSQAMMPATRSMADPIRGVLNIMSLKEFERGFAFDEFGSYDPVEHMDNPALLRASGAYDQGAMPTVGDDSYANQSEVVPILDSAGRPTGRSGFGAAAGTDDQAYADVDDRYARTVINEAAVSEENRRDAAAFHVDDSGIPRYMHTSKHLLKVQLKNAARLGRSGNGDRGPRQFSSAAHIMQDYYAHSNFCEVGVNILIRSGTLRVRNEHGRMETLDASRGVLDTRMHQNNAQGNPVDANMTRQNAAGQTIETMTTGSFTLTDTAASILEEVADMWKQLNPFRTGSSAPSPLVNACLDFMEMNAPDSFSGLSSGLIDIINSIKPQVEALAPTAASVVEGAGELGGQAAENAGQAASWGLGLLNQANAALGGDDDYFDSEQQAVQGAGNRAGASVRSAASAGADGIRGVNTQLTALAASLEGEEHILRRAYTWVHENVKPMEAIIEFARGIPVIGPPLADLLENGSRRLKAWAEEQLGNAWNAAIDAGVVLMEGTIGLIRGQTNMDDLRTAGAGDGIVDGVQRTLGGVGDMYENGRPTNGIAPGSYTVPSHTQIAKDHADVTQGARDHHGDSASDPSSRREADAGHDSHEGHDHHGHVHEGAFLANIAQALAMQATAAIGEPVNSAWDAVARAGGAGAAAAVFDDQIEQVVNTYFNHPSACGYWQAPMRSAAGGTLGPGILDHLSAAAAGTPADGEVFAGPGNDSDATADADGADYRD